MLESDDPPIAVVLPAKDASSLLDECLASLADQLGQRDALVVVDDGSRDETVATAAAHGAQVIRRAQSGGPYLARNDGWRQTEQPYVLFIDARCVAREGLIAAVRSAAREGADLIFGDILIRDGGGVAERAAAQRQHLRLDSYQSDIFLPFGPTACLAIRREALEHVGGFRRSPSGGDADLCWRVQLAGHRQLAIIGEPLMEWRARTSLSSYFGQFRKYGKSSAQLRYAYASQGATVPRAHSLWLLVASAPVRLARRLLRQRRLADLPMAVINFLVDLTLEFSYRGELRALQSGAVAPMFQLDASQRAGSEER